MLQPVTTMLMPMKTMGLACNWTSAACAAVTVSPTVLATAMGMDLKQDMTAMATA